MAEIAGAVQVEPVLSAEHLGSLLLWALGDFWVLGGTVEFRNSRNSEMEGLGYTRQLQLVRDHSI